MTPVPPLAAVVMVPLLPPLQLGSLKLALLTTTAVGSVIATVVVPEHKFPSVAGQQGYLSSSVAGTITTGIG